MEQRIKKTLTLGKYILKGKKIVECTDLLEWGRWFEEPKNRIVKQETLDNDLWVSTIFLGLDHNYSGKGAPILFETMVFFPEEERIVFGKIRSTYLLLEDLDKIKAEKTTIIILLQYDQDLAIRIQLNFPDGEAVEENGLWLYKIN